MLPVATCQRNNGSIVPPGDVKEKWWIPQLYCSIDIHALAFYISVSGDSPTIRLVVRGERWKSEIYVICPRYYVDKEILRPGNVDNFVIDTSG